MKESRIAKWALHCVTRKKLRLSALHIKGYCLEMDKIHRHDMGQRIAMESNGEEMDCLMC